MCVCFYVRRKKENRTTEMPPNHPLSLPGNTQNAAQMRHDDERVHGGPLIGTVVSFSSKRARIKVKVKQLGTAHRYVTCVTKMHVAV